MVPKNTVIIIVRALLLALVFGSAHSAQYHAPPDFRGHKWGKDLSEFAGLVQITDDGNSSIYSDPAEPLTIGEATLESLGYAFYKGKFFSVFIQFEGAGNARELLRALKSKYGEGNRPNQFMDRYVWGTTSDVTIAFTYSSVTGAGTLTYAYVPILKERNADKEAAAAQAKDQL